MDPNQQPQAPQQPNQNQYDYILNSPTPKKPSVMNMGGGQKSRKLVSIIFVLVVVTAALVGFAIFRSATKKDYSTYKALLNSQTEIVRIADLGVSKARRAAIKNYVASIKSVTTSEKNDTLAYLKTSNVNVDEKALALKKDADNDKALATAEQANQYDEKLTSILNTLIIAYQKDIKSLGGSITTKSERTLVTTLQNNAKVIANAPKSE